MGKYEILLRVCQTRSISKTAQDLHYTQSAVSQAIKSFENELGMPLFRRSRLGMELLPNTEEIVEALTAICREKARMEEIARNLTSLETGYIRIGSIQSISYHWLPDILEEFSRLYPRIRFEMTVNGFQELKEKLNRKELYCIFVSQYAVPGLPFLPLGEDELMLAAPMDHPLSRKPAVSLSDIQQQNFILSADGLDYETGEIFRQNGITPVIRYRLNEDFATLKMVEKGFGITILPRLLLYHAPFQVCVRPFTEHYTRTLGIAYAADTAPSLAAERFMDFVKGWSQEHLPV